MATFSSEHKESGNLLLTFFVSPCPFISISISFERLVYYAYRVRCYPSGHDFPSLHSGFKVALVLCAQAKERCFMPSQFPQYVGWIYPERNYFFLLPFFSLPFADPGQLSDKTGMNLTEGTV